MATVEVAVPPLRVGDCLTREEFLRRWESMPDLKRAELIGGVVYMPSPVSRDHGRMEFIIANWLGDYMLATPGTLGDTNSTWLMAGEAPQPDCSFCILASHGGQSHEEGRYAAGAPEFIAEVCASSADYDLHQKFALYERAGVREYLAALVWEQEVRWHTRAGNRLVAVAAPADGVYRSGVFPGLWLDAPALLALDLARVLATLRQGLDSAEHARFAADLAARVRDGQNPGTGR